MYIIEDHSPDRAYTPKEFNQYILGLPKNAEVPAKIVDRDFYDPDRNHLTFHGGDSIADQVKKKADTVDYSDTYVTYQDRDYSAAKFNQMVCDWNHREDEHKEIQYVVNSPYLKSPMYVKQIRNDYPIDLEFYDFVARRGDESGGKEAKDMFTYLQGITDFIQGEDDAEFQIYDDHISDYQIVEDARYDNSIKLYDLENAQSRVDSAEDTITKLRTEKEFYIVQLEGSEDVKNIDMEAVLDQGRNFTNMVNRLQTQQNGIIDTRDYTKFIWEKPDPLNMNQNLVTTELFDCSKGPDEKNLNYPENTRISSKDRYLKVNNRNEPIKSSNDIKELMPKEKSVRETEKAEEDSKETEKPKYSLRSIFRR